MTDTASAAPSEREQFEAWAKSHGTLLTKDKRGNYQYTPTSAMWKAWQAARAQPTPPAVVEPLTRYRLLRPEADRIEAGDEFLSEDTLTWAVDPNGIFVGMIYGGRALRPARRAIKGADHG